MAFDVRVGRRAQRYLDHLDTNTQKRISKRLDLLEHDPIQHSKPLRSPNPGFRAVRVGGYRIVIDEDTANRIVEVLNIAPRGQVYRDL